MTDSAAARVEAAPRILPRQEVHTRDGVALCTDVFLPPEDGPRPTVVVRTPYGRQMLFLLFLAQRLNRSGFAVVLQDCRGRYQSGGTFSPEHEEGDGHDTLRWVAAQPWFRGELGLMGLSVSSLSNFQIAADAAEDGVEVGSVVSIMGAVDSHRAFYRNGALVHHWALPWVSLISPEGTEKAGWQDLDWDAAFRRLPLVEAAEHTRGDTDLWRGAVTRPRYQESWRRLSALEKLREVRAPVLLLGGWNDFLLGHTLLAYRALREGDGGADRLRRLVVGPWNHRTFAAGRKSFYRAGEQGMPDVLGLVAEWFEGSLDGGAPPEVPVEGPPEPPEVVLFVQRRLHWVGLPSFPAPGAETVEWYLRSGGQANSAAGDGELVREVPERPGSDSYAYDPDEPVPTIGGAVWPFPPTGLAAGPADQSPVEARPDVLVYTSAPLERDLSVVGPVELELFAASSAVDTDFTAKLVDLEPSGRALIVQDGIVRARFREGPEEESLLAPHRPERFVVPLEATAYCFQAGHRIRLEVSSSNFPKFDRHLNTSGPLHSATHGMVATQTVLHGGSTASRLRLPVVPDEVLDAARFSPPASWGGDAR